MKVSELKVEMDERFKEVDERFKAVDERFRELQAQVISEGEKTRRHFDIVAKAMDAKFSTLFVDIAARTRALEENRSEHTTFAGILDDHELRLKALERIRRH